MRSKLVFVIAGMGLLAACGGGGSSSGAVLVSSPVVQPPQSDEKLYYGATSRQFGVLHMPMEGVGPFPVVALFHGGCWQNAVGNYMLVDALANALAKKGWAVWNVEYRSVDNEGGGWPNTFRDAADAVDYLRVLKKDYALDLGKVVFMGHSAGGHLALWAASRDRIPADSVLKTENPLLPQRAIGLAAITDLDDYYRVGGACGSVIPLLIQQARLEEVSPLKMLPTSMPLSLITGSLDTIVPSSQENSYVQAAQAAGVSVRTAVIQGDHFALTVAGGLSEQIIESELEQVLH